jgi:hypothetical protein
MAAAVPFFDQLWTETSAFDPPKGEMDAQTAIEANRTGGT